MNNDVAIFLDLDNIVIAANEANLPFDITLILDHVRELTNGRIVLRRAYGDWRQSKKVPEQLATAGFELQSVVRIGQLSKNLADMQMVVDAMETLIDGHDFANYVLITGDRDFMPVIQALRKRGKIVVGVGVRHSCSNSLIDLCDNYVFYDDLVPTPEQLSAEHVAMLIDKALDDLLQGQSYVPASQLKQHMQTLSNGAFGESAQGKQSFRQLLEQYPDLVALTQEGSMLCVSRTNDSVGTEPAGRTSEPLDEKEIEGLLKRSLDELLNGDERARASLLKQRMQELSQGQFDDVHQDGSFRVFLARFPHLVHVQQENSTLYVARPAAGAPAVAAEDLESLHILYRTGLKKRGLRVVPGEMRLTLLKELVHMLQSSPTRWQEIVDTLAEKYAQDPHLAVSKSMVNDLLRVARRAGVIDVDNRGQSVAVAPVSINLQGDRLFQESAMLCDTAYLKEIRSLSLPLDLEKASLALYDNLTRTRYLQVLLKRADQNEKNGVAA